MHNDRLAECLALFGIVKRIFVCGTCNAERLCTNCRSSCFECRHRRLFATRSAFAIAREFGVEFFFATQQTTTRHANIFEHNFGSMTGANAVLHVFLTLAQTFCFWWHNETCLTATFEFGVYGGDNNVNISNATVCDPCFGAVQNPFVFRFVINGARAQI